MSRLCLVALALCAVVAAVSANAPPPNHGSAPAGHPNHVKEWVHQKGAQIKQWAHNAKVKAGEDWQKTVAPKIAQLKKQFGEKWQEKEPKVAAALKKQAGIYFDKAVQFVNQQLSKLGH